MPSEPQPISIRIFLPDGTPDGLRVVGKSLWTGVGVTCSRARYPTARARPEFVRPGVYVLVGPHPANPLASVVYIGQAEIANDRLDQHLKGKDFWERLVLFTDGSGTLNNANFRYLEARLIQIALTAKRATVANGNQPGGVTLSEADRADTEAFLRDMLLIYPLVDVDAFEELPTTAPTPGTVLTLTAMGREATGRDTPEGFVVCEGASVWKESPSFHDKSYRLLRQQLIQNGVIVMTGDVGAFAQDYPFRSPSAAASVARGSQQNGLDVWRDATGRTLKALQAAAVGLVRD